MSSYLLLASLAIGIIIILITMIFNIVASIRKKDFHTGIFSVNGIVGLVFYVAVIVGAIMKTDPMMAAYSFTPPYLIMFVFLPLALLFFKEPICEYLTVIAREHARKKINKDKQLAKEMQVYGEQYLAAKSSGNKTEMEITQNSIASLMKCKFFRSRYGKMKYESYELLPRFSDRRFSFVPFSSDDKYVMGAYISPVRDFATTDKIMSLLGFQALDTVQSERTSAVPSVKHITHEKKSVGNFIMENFIELFENLLNYFANTMSFLRVGGFVLAHAGLMMVVGILAGMAGKPLSVGWLIVEILGNLFVIGMEGFLVGIQALRLEFYEMFGRFYEPGGKPFTPITADVNIEN
jgi:V/A-type H+-transporting ATPase subunit I